MLDIVEVYDTEILLIECADGDVLEMVGSAIIVGGAVASVNAKTGNVVLTAADVDADPVGAANDVLVELQPQIDTINQQLPNLATQNYVLTGLTPKASIVYVDNALAAKADVAATSTALATKATVTQLNEVKTLAETNQLNVSTKAEQADLDAANATVAEHTQTLLTKADVAALTALTQLVDTKADQSYVISEIARITGNAPAALDTLAEIAEQLGNDQTQINNLLDQIGNRVRFDAAQALTAPEQTQARDNINAEAKGVAASLVSGVTTTSIGAATTAQGTKADTALQSADVAPVALSGSFSDLVNKSSLFSLVYSAYAIGSNVAVSASDTLGQMLGKLQAQISSNVTAINAKEPTIGTGTTSQYWRGDKAWRDFATDVRGTVLTGLSTATATAITATDTVIVGLGKTQAQITANSTAISNNASAIAAKVDVVQLTKAQYDALSTSDKNLATKLYVIVG